MKIYLIRDATGRYEDHVTSIIKAFKDKDQAEAYELKYNNLLDKLKNHAEVMADKAHKDCEYYDSMFQYIDERYDCRINEIELI